MANPEWTDPGDWEDAEARLADLLIERVKARQQMRARMPGADNALLALELECMVGELERIRAEQVSA